MCETRQGVLGVYVYKEGGSSVCQRTILDAFEIKFGNIHNTPLWQKQSFYPPTLASRDDSLYAFYLAEPVEREETQFQWMNGHEQSTVQEVCLFERALNLGEQCENLRKPQVFMLDIENRRILRITNSTDVHLQINVLNDEGSMHTTFDLLVTKLHPRHAWLGIQHHSLRARTQTILRIDVISGIILGAVDIFQDQHCLRDFLLISNEEERFTLACLSYPDVGEHSFSALMMIVTFDLIAESADSHIPISGESTPDNRTCDTKDGAIALRVANLLTEESTTKITVPPTYLLLPEYFDHKTKKGWIPILDRGKTSFATFSCNPQLSLDVPGRIEHITSRRMVVDRDEGNLWVCNVRRNVITPSNRYYGFFVPSTPERSVIVYRRRNLPAHKARFVLLHLHGGPNSMESLRNGTHAFFDFIFASTPVDLIVVPNYPGSVGYGDNYTLALAGNCGHLDVNWCLQALKDAIQLERGSEGTNGVRSLVYGGSHGGFLAAHVACLPQKVVDGAILVNPVTDASMHSVDIPDWAAWQFAREKYNLNCRTPDSTAMRQAQYCSSPIAHAQEIKCPILMLLGLEDKRVDWHQGANFYKRVLELEEERKTTEPRIGSRCFTYGKSNHSLQEPSILFHRDIECAKFINEIATR